MHRNKSHATSAFFLPVQRVTPRANSVFFRVPTLGHRRASATRQSLDVKTIQTTERQSHRHSNTLAERGFGFTDDHDRVLVEWFRYPDDEPDDYTDDGITDMPLVTREGGLRRKRTNGAAISRAIFPVNDPEAAARFVQFLIDQKYAPAATAALFITVGIERRFNYRVAADVGVTNHRFSYWLRKARRAMTAETVPVPPIDLPDEQEPKRPVTDYWRKTVNHRTGRDIREAVKATMRQMLEAEPRLSDATLARKLTERAKVAISRRTVAKYRMDLGIRRLKAERRKPGETPETIRRRQLSEIMKQRHAKSPLSEEARRRIAEGQKRRWAAWKAGQAA